MGWWAHELTHVKQYGEMGVDGFAYRYMVTLGHDLEDPAYAMQDLVNGATQNRAGATSAMNTFGGLYGTPQGSVAFGGRIVTEYFVAQCVFPADRFPVNYLITNTNRIIMVNPVNGQWAQIGWAMPPRLYGGGKKDAWPEARFIIRWKPIGANSGSCESSSRRLRANTARPVRLPAVVSPRGSRRPISDWRRGRDGGRRSPCPWWRRRKALPRRKREGGGDVAETSQTKSLSRRRVSSWRSADAPSRQTCGRSDAPLLSAARCICISIGPH
jgi:hypothetical protein